PLPSPPPRIGGRGGEGWGALAAREGARTMTTIDHPQNVEPNVAGAVVPAYDPRALEAGRPRRRQGQGRCRGREGGGKPKSYCLDFFPYPSGDALSVGHCRNYVPTDTMSRYMRMRGYNVLHPMGWDAFGEPAEQHAVAQGVHPRVTTDRNIARYK